MKVKRKENKWLVPRRVPKWKRMLILAGEIFAGLSIFGAAYFLFLVGYACQ